MLHLEHRLCASSCLLKESTTLSLDGMRSSKLPVGRSRSPQWNRKRRSKGRHRNHHASAAVQPFRVNFTFDPTGYAGAVGVREGEEVLVSGEREGGWSVVCWPDGREHGIVPSNFIERLDKLTQPVRPFEEKDNLKVDVTPSPPTPKDETPRRCFLTSKEIVKCAHLLNEPGVFYEYDKLIDFVRKNEMSPHSFQPVSLEDIVKDN